MTTQFNLFQVPATADDTDKKLGLEPVDVRPIEGVDADLFAGQATACVEEVATDAFVETLPEEVVDSAEVEHRRCIAEQLERLQAAKDTANNYLLPDVNINEAFSSLVILRVEQYLADLEGVEGLPTYDMIVSAAERPLLKWAMDKAGGKQLAAAKILGINRNTLRKKLRMHGFLEGDFE